MKVKILYTSYITSNLDKKINEFIKDKFVWDIKYQIGKSYYSVLIMYDESGD